MECGEATNATNSSTGTDDDIKCIIIPPKHTPTPRRGETNPFCEKGGGGGGGRHKGASGSARVITLTKKWNFSVEDLANQYQVMLNLAEKTKGGGIYGGGGGGREHELIPLMGIEKVIIQQIKQKLNSYRYQDQLKGIYDPALNCNSVEFIISLLCERQLRCYYCDKQTLILYENVCESLQWTLERFNNSMGHNRNNVTIACLKCNIGRRTMHENRYLFTKKTINVILEDR